MSNKVHTAERVSDRDASDNFVYQRSLLAYYLAAGEISGNVLELGTGTGYGISILSPQCSSFVTIDKTPPVIDTGHFPNVELVCQKVPPLSHFENDSFDYVVTFQVIEHIRRDKSLVREVYRVLKPGGKLIISTPNKLMSLTRNPWHVREYTPEQFRELLAVSFSNIRQYGIAGNDKVAAYYENNRLSVARFKRFDILRFNRWLPKPLLRIPYDILNRINRRKLLQQDSDLTSGITMEDYYRVPASDSCYDLFYIATK